MKLNNSKRNRLKDAVGVLNSLIDKISDEKYDEVDKYNNLPVGLQESDRGIDMEDVVDNLDDALADLKSARGYIETAINL